MAGAPAFFRPETLYKRFIKPCGLSRGKIGGKNNNFLTQMVNLFLFFPEKMCEQAFFNIINIRGTFADIGIINSRKMRGNFA